MNRIAFIAVVIAILVAVGTAIPLSQSGNGVPGAGLISTTSVYTASPANCGQVEFDIFNLNTNGSASQDLFQYISLGSIVGQGVNFAAVQPYVLTLPQSITANGIQLEIILSTLQGSYTGATGGTIGPFTFLVDTISVNITTANGFSMFFPQNYSAAGNNFTFTNATVGNGSASVITNFTVTITQVANATVPTTATCSVTYVLEVINPQNTSVKGDPQFVGLRGQNYQIHGIDGAVYNIISDKDYQLNSRFIFLTGPRPCPLIPSTGRKSAACWSHPGSFLGQIGLKTSSGDTLFISAGPADVGFEMVKVNGKHVKINDSTDLFSYNSTHELTVHFGPFTIEFENSDMFINLRSVFLPAGALSKLKSHGLLGQTWNNQRYSGTVKEIEGDVDDYMIAEDDVFGDSFLFNKFE